MATITFQEVITDDNGDGMTASSTLELGTSDTALFHNVLTVSNELRLFSEFGNSEQGAPIKLNGSWDGYFGAIINRSKTQRLLVRLGQVGSSEYFDHWVKPQGFFILPMAIDESGSIYYNASLGDLRMRFEYKQEQAEVVLLTYSN
jgi:hypothetical protein